MYVCVFFIISDKPGSKCFIRLNRRQKQCHIAQRINIFITEMDDS